MPGTGFEVRVEGLRELNKSLRKVGGDYPKELKAIHKDVAEIVAQRAETRAPRLTGRLISSIRPQGALRYGRVAAGRKSVPYAGPIHWGWAGHGIEPQPFLVEALHEKQPEVMLVWKDKTDRFIDRVWTTIR